MVSSMPSLRPPMQKNLSPAPVRTITRVLVSRRMAFMQSRSSWHIVTLNMLPSSGRFSVMMPIGPSSSYLIVSKVMVFPWLAGHDEHIACGERVYSFRNVTEHIAQDGGAVLAEPGRSAARPAGPTVHMDASP